MAHVHQFVDAISGTPLVLADLDVVTSVKDARTPPPELRRTSSFSMSINGDNVSSSSYMDRRIIITLNANSGTAEAQATAIQKLGRLLSAPSGQWLKWQHNGMTEPVFFRTKRADIDVLDYLLADDPKRTITLEIPAEPFAYGLPVTGSASISNDPTTGTNRISYVFPSIKGDVTTPLWLEVVTTDTAQVDVIAASLSTDLTLPAIPIHTAMPTSNLTAAPAGWASSVVSSASYIGGSARRYTRSSGVTSFTPTIVSPATPINIYLPNLRPSEYRVFVRAIVSTPTWELNVGIDDATTGNTRSVESGWNDFGVMLLPAHSKPETVLLGPDGGTVGSLYMTLTFINAGTGDIDIDSILLVPVGESMRSSAKYLRTTPDARFASGTPLVIDGVNQLVAVTSSAAYALVSPVVGAGFPEVTPGRNNVVSLFLSDGDPAITNTVNWLYYPRYLYIRPATT